MRSQSKLRGTIGLRRNLKSLINSTIKNSSSQQSLKKNDDMRVVTACVCQQRLGICVCRFSEQSKRKKEKNDWQSVFKREYAKRYKSRNRSNGSLKIVNSMRQLPTHQSNKEEIMSSMPDEMSLYSSFEVQSIIGPDEETQQTHAQMHRTMNDL